MITAELARTAKMYDDFDPADDASAARSLVGNLGFQHVRHLEQECPLPSLLPEIARADLWRLTATSEYAWTLMTQNGGVLLARAIPDEELQREILTVLRQAGEKLLSDSPTRSIGCAD